MHNYSDGYLLNYVLVLAEKYGFFNRLCSQKIEGFSRDILQIGSDFDCNGGEVFEKIGGKIGFCYICQKGAEEFIDDVCEECDSELVQMPLQERDDLLSEIQKLKLEGRQQERRKIAKNMLDKGVDLQFIKEATQLSNGELSRLH